MIRIIAGLNGGGKSLYAAWLMAQVARRRPLYTNFELTPSHPRFADAVLIGGADAPVRCEHCGYGLWDFVPKRASAVVVIDEADLYFDCFCFEELRLAGAWAWLKQQRKGGLDIFLVVQDPDTLYNRLRMLAGESIYCERETFELVKQDLGLIGAWLVPERQRPWRRCLYMGAKFKTLLRADSCSYREAQRVFGWYHTQQELYPVSACDRCGGNGPTLSERRGGGRPAYQGVGGLDMPLEFGA